MFKASSKETAPSASVSAVTAPSSLLSSKAGTLRVTPEGGLRLVGDGGVLGKSNISSSQQGEKQKFFATRSADGKWNLLMAPTSDPSRLFLVQPAPGHRFQVAGGGVRMESTSTASPVSSGELSSASNGCVEEQRSGLSSPESGDLIPCTSKSIAVPIAQLWTPSIVSPPCSTHTITAPSFTDISTTASAAELSLHSQKKPSFFKSRTARDREALKASAQHVVGKKVLTTPRKGSTALGGDGAEKGKKSKSARASKSHGKSSKLPTPLQESMSQCFSLMSMSSVDSSSATTSATDTPTTATTSSSTCTDTTTTVSTSFTSSTSTTHTSPSSSATSSTRMASPFDSRAHASPSSSLPCNETSNLSPPTSPPSNSSSPSFASHLRSSLSSAVGDVCDIARRLDAQMERTSSRKSDLVNPNEDCECEGDANHDEELCTVASVSSAGSASATSEETSSLARAVDGSDSKTEKESSGNNFYEDLKLPCQSTDVPEHSSGVADASPPTIPDSPRVAESRNDDVDGNGQGNSLEQTDHDEKDTKDLSSSHQLSCANRKKDADEDSSATDVSDTDDGHPRLYSYRSRRGAAAGSSQMSCSAEHQRAGKEVKMTVDDGDVSVRRHSKRQKAMPKVTYPGSASDTDDYEVTADTEKETRKPSSKENREDSNDREFVMSVETGKGTEKRSLRKRYRLKSHDLDHSDTVAESSQTYSVGQAGTEKGQIQFTKFTRKDDDDDTRDSVQPLAKSDKVSGKNVQPQSVKLKRVDYDDDVDESELLRAVRDESLEKSHSDFRATADHETDSQDRQRSLAAKTKYSVCREAGVGRERHERTCRTGPAAEHSPTYSRRVSETSGAECTNPVPLNTAPTGIVTSSKQNQPKKRRKRKSELEALIADQEAEEESRYAMEASENASAQEESAVASQNESASASQEELAITSQKGSVAVSLEEVAITSQNESAAVSQEELAITSQKESAAVSLAQNESTAVSQEELAITSQKESASASQEELAITSQKESAAVLQEELAITSQKESAAVSQEELAITSQKESAAVSQEDLAITSQKESAAVSQEELAITSQKESTAVSQEDLAITSQKESAAVSQEELAITSQKESAAVSQEELAITSQKESAAVSQEELAITSQKESAAVSLEESTIRSQKETTSVSQEESAIDSQRDSVPTSEKESARAEDLVSEEPKTSHQEPERFKTPESISDLAEEEAVSNEEKKQRKKRKKKKKLKLLISLGKAKSKDITDHASEQSFPSSVTDTVPEDQGGSARTEHKQPEDTVMESLEQSSGGDGKDQKANSDRFSGRPVQSLTKTHTKVGGPKKKKKNRKLKIIFGSGQETSTREIPDVVTSDSNSRNECNIVLETYATDSLNISQNLTDSDTSTRDLTAKFSSEKQRKKVRRKRLTELETLIQDQETLSRPDLVAVDENPGLILEADDADSGNRTKSSEPCSTKEAETSEVKLAEESESSDGFKSVVEALPSRDTGQKRSNQQPKKGTLHLVSKKIEKPKKKKKIKRKIMTAGVTTLPPLTSETDTDATEPITDLDDITDSTQNAPDVGGSLPTESDLPPPTRDTDSAVSTDKDEEEDAETKAEKAMTRFLTNRSFSQWELAGMFGTPFVVLERLSEKDIYFMSRRFRNARVSSRARCSAHCRTRTLGYLCELKLINCQPPPGFNKSKRAVPDCLPDGTDQQSKEGEPPKKKKKKKDAEVKDGEEKPKKRKKKKKDEADKVVSDDVILIDEPDKAPSVSQGPSKLFTTTSAVSGFTTSSGGRVVRLAPAPGRPSCLQPSSGQTAATTGPRFITIPAIPAKGASSLPQIITIPSLAATSSGPSRIIIPSLLAKAATVTTTSSPSLKDATRASLAQAISKSLIKAGHVPISTTSIASTTNTSVNPVLISALSGSGLPRAPAVVTQVPVAPGLASTTQSSATVPRQFLVVQMGDKRVLVPATALTTTTTPSLSAPVVTTTAGPSLQSVVTVGAGTVQRTSVSLGSGTVQRTSVSLGSGTVQRTSASLGSGTVQRTTVTAPTVLTDKTAAGVRVSNPTSLIPGTVARIVLSNRRANAPLAPRTGPTASSLLFANRPALARPNQAWAGPRTVDSNKRVLVTPATQPQGIKVVLSGAGSISSGTRFTVASSRGGVFVASRQPTSLVRMAPPGQARKRVMTEEERLRKRARLEKKYPLPPGVVIKTEPVTQGYGDEGKTVQASSTATRVYVSSVPVGAVSRAQVNLNQPVPVMSAMRGGSIIIRQATPASSSQRASSLLGPLIIRVPCCTGTSTSSATSTRIALPSTASLLSSSARLTAPTRTTAPMAISLLNAGPAVTTSTMSLATSTLTSSASLISSVRSSVSSVSQTSSAVSGTVSSVSSAASTSATSAVTSLETRSVNSANNTAQSEDDDAIIIADSPPPETAAREAEEPPRSQPVPASSSSFPPAAVAVVTTAAFGTSRTSPSPDVSVISSSIPTSTPTVSSTTATTTASCSTPSFSTSSPASPVPSTSCLITSSRLASLGALWVRQAAESPGSIPSIDARSLQSERMRRLKETLAKQIENIGDERRQKALQALHQKFCLAGDDGAATSEETSAAHGLPVSGGSDASSANADGRSSEGAIEIDLTETGGSEESVSRSDGRGGSDSVTNRSHCSDVGSSEVDHIAQNECVADRIDQDAERMEIREMAEAEKRDESTAESDGQDKAEDTSKTDSGKPEWTQNIAAPRGRDSTEESSIETDGAYESARGTDREVERVSETPEREGGDAEHGADTSGKEGGDAEHGAVTSGKEGGDAEHGADTSGKESGDAEHGADTSGKEAGDAERGTEISGGEDGDTDRAAETTGSEEGDLERAAETTEKEEGFIKPATKASENEEEDPEHAKEISERDEGDTEHVAETSGMEGGDGKPAAVEFIDRGEGGAEHVEGTQKEGTDCEAGNIDGDNQEKEGHDDVADTTDSHHVTSNKQTEGDRAVNARDRNMSETDNSGTTTGESDSGGMGVEIVISDGEESQTATR